MERVEITNPFVGLTGMQVCAVKDATDEEILKVCNSQNPSGTKNGWSKVVRESDKEDYPSAVPGQCADYPDRLHFIVIC